MSVSYKDYYKILEVDRTATKEEIDKAYKKLARKYHPDLNQGDSKAEERFKEINEAHEVLKDPQKRKLYDQLGPNWKDGQNFQGAPGFENFFNFQGGQGGFGGGDFSDFFEVLFGQGGGGFSGGFGQTGRPRSRKGQDVETTVHITLEEAHKGGPKEISFHSPEGYKSLKVNIPKGIKNGGKLRLAGQGRTGSPNGDLYLTIQYAQHENFRTEDFDVTVDVFISPVESVFGTKLRVPTLEGEVELNIPAGVKSGKKLRLKGKGIAGKGDEYVVIGIEPPSLDTMTEKEKALWQELLSLSK